ncbi:MAG: putative Ig domain-containing protein, partial [Chloroflexota bacterium]
MNYTFTSDEQFLVYQEKSGSLIINLYSVSTGGGTAVRLNEDLTYPSGQFSPETGYIRDFEMSPDGTQLAYTASASNPTAFELFSVPIAGGDVVRMHRPFETNTFVDYNAKYTADSARIIYISNQDIDAQSSDQATDLFVSYVGDQQYAPEILSQPSSSANTGQEYEYEIKVTDRNVSDLLTISASGLPSWLALTDHGDGTATLSGSPIKLDVGTSTILIEARDDTDRFADQSLLLTVNLFNNEPKIFDPSEFDYDYFPELTFISAGSDYQYTLAATDSDVEDTLTFSIDNLPDWLTLQNDERQRTARLIGRPTEADVETYSLVATVTDPGGKRDSRPLLIQVNSANDPYFASATSLLYQDNPAFDVTDLKLDSDRSQFVFVSTNPITGGNEIYIENYVGRYFYQDVEERKLDALPETGIIQAFEIVGDDRYVVNYVEEDGIFNLYLDLISTTIKEHALINPPTSTGKGVFSPFMDTPYLISERYGLVIFLSDHDVNGLPELYNFSTDVYDILAPQFRNIKLNLPLAAGERIINFMMTPDGEKLIYQVDKEQGGSQLFEVDDPNVGAAVPTSIDLPAGDQFEMKMITADSRFLLLEAFNPTASAWELYKLDLATDEIARLFTAPNGERFDHLSESPNGQFALIYFPSQDSERGGVLYTLNIGLNTMATIDSDGRLNGQLFDDFFVTPDSASVVLIGSNIDQARRLLYKSPIEGGTFERFDPLPTQNGSVSLFDVASNGIWAAAVFEVEEADGLKQALYVINLEDGSMLALLEDLAVGRQIEFIKINDDSDYVIFAADLGTEGVRELYAINTDGGSLVKLNQGMVAGGNVGAWADFTQAGR